MCGRQVGQKGERGEGSSCTICKLLGHVIVVHIVGLGLVRDFLDGVLAIEQRRRLLQRPVLGLHEEDPQKDEFADEPADVHKLDGRKWRISTTVHL